jgi:hypothetical protein
MRDAERVSGPLQTIWMGSTPAVLGTLQPARGGNFRGSNATWMVAFSWVAPLLPVSLAIGRIFGPVAGTWAHAVSAMLIALQLVLPPPQLNVGPLAVARPLAGGQRVRQAVRLPLGTAGWTRLWSRDPQPEAYIYVNVLVPPGTSDPRLALQLNGRPFASLEAQTLLPKTPSDEANVWHRIHVSRADLEAAPILETVITARPDGAAFPGRVGVLGGFSFRPSAPVPPPAFSSGSTWETDPNALFEGVHLPSGTPVRYYVDVRLIDSKTRDIIATYY